LKIWLLYDTSGSHLRCPAPLDHDFRFFLAWLHGGFEQT